MEEDHLRVILNQIKNEILLIFPRAVQANLAQIIPSRDRVLYAISILSGTRIRTARPLKSLSVEREIVVRVSSIAQKRGLDTQEDLNEKSGFMNSLGQLIINIERNSIIDELDVAQPIAYISDTGVAEIVGENDVISLNTEIKFLSQTITFF